MCRGGFIRHRITQRPQILHIGKMDNELRTTEYQLILIENFMDFEEKEGDLTAKNADLQQRWAILILIIYFCGGSGKASGAVRAVPFGFVP
jgi:hypothetical protein